MVGAWVVQHDDCSVLDVVEPPLPGRERVFSKLGPERAVVAVGGDQVLVGDLVLHAEVL